MTSSDPTYDAFFRTATGGQAPYAYQRRLACGEPSRTAGNIIARFRAGSVQPTHPASA